MNANWIRIFGSLCNLKVLRGKKRNCHAQQLFWLSDKDSLNDNQGYLFNINPLSANDWHNGVLIGIQEEIFFAHLALDS